MFDLRFVSVIIHHHSIASIIYKGLMGRNLCFFSQVIYLVLAVTTLLLTVYIFFMLFLFVPRGPIGTL